MNSKINFSGWLGLFASFGTLVCCVLPVTLVSLGMGAAMASLAVKAPGLVWMSENKIPVFLMAGLMIALAALVQFLNRNQPCPIDPKLRDACTSGRIWGRRLLVLSVVIYLVGALFAFVLSDLLFQ